MIKKRIAFRAFQIAAALITVCIMGFSFVLSGKTVRAGDIIITGDAAGYLTITSSDRLLFDLSGLYPGDAGFSSVTIRNEDMVNQGFELSMYVENAAEAEYDLGHVTNLQITRENNEIYKGLLIMSENELGAATPVNLGRIGRGEIMTLYFTIELDGFMTDNRYQEQDSHFIVTFNANSYGPPVTPPTDPPVTDEDEPDEDEPYEPPVIPEIITVIPEEDEPEYVIIDIGPVPLSMTPETPDSSEPDEDEPEDQVIIDDIETPLRDFEDKEMPKTGERSLFVYIIAGIVLIICGFLVIKRKNRGEGHIERRDS